MVFHLQQGSSPLLVSMPHIASAIPAQYAASFVPEALAAPDTDWHLDALYDFLPALGASVLKPAVSRYVIGLNRPPDDAPMYPGAANTELCPTSFFTGTRSTKQAAHPTPAPLQRAACAIGSPTTMRWQPNCNASNRCTVMRCSGTRTVFAASCLGYLKASCPI